MLQILYFLAFLPRIAQISDGSVPSENVKYFMVGPETQKKKKSETMMKLNKRKNWAEQKIPISVTAGWTRAYRRVFDLL